LGLIPSAILLALLLTKAQSQTAEAPTTLDLSCDGTKKEESGTARPIGKMHLTLNLAEQSLSGFALIAQIDSLTDATITFSGHATRDRGATSVIGYLDRVTGVMWATTVWQAGENEIIGAETYDLSCKIIDRLL
jgi:hypothetical protein